MDWLRRRLVRQSGAILGIFLAGAAYVPLDPRFPADRLHYMVADSGLAIALVDNDALASTVGVSIDLSDNRPCCS